MLMTVSLTDWLAVTISYIYHEQKMDFDAMPRSADVDEIATTYLELL